MDNILLCSNHIPLVTSIHNTFIEKYMLRANGSYVKVYLYLSKCIQAGQDDLSISSLADQMENTEKDIIRALNYWEKQGLLRITRSEDGSEILGIDVLNPDELVTDTAAPMTGSASHTESTMTPIMKSSGRAEAVTGTSVRASTGKADASKSAEAEAASNGTAKHVSSKTAASPKQSDTSAAVTASGTQTDRPVPPADSAVQTGRHTSPADSAEQAGRHTFPADSAAQTDGQAFTQQSGRHTSPAASKATGSTTASADKLPAPTVTTEQMNRLAGNDDFCWTCDIVESYLRHPIKPKELEFVTYLYDTLHFSSELILHLYEYCIGLGKTNISYIQTVALAWDEKGVKTTEDAQNASMEYNATYTAISKSMALGRTLAAIEREFVDRWQNQWQMDLSVILEACNRTMLKLQHGDFKYADGILERWYRTGVHTLQDVHKADEDFAREKAAKRQAAAAQHGNKSGMVQHGLSRKEADALEKQLLHV